jgi:hypothetical protein
MRDIERHYNAIFLRSEKSKIYKKQKPKCFIKLPLMSLI